LAAAKCRGLAVVSSGMRRDRRFALLWAGQTISEFGSAITTLALPLIAVLTLDATAFQTSLVAAATTVAWLVVGLPAGAWVDRVRRRPVLIATDLGRALALATVPAAWALQRLTIAHLIAVAAVTGVLGVISVAAEPVFLTAIVDRDRLVDANGKLVASASAANVGGPGLGGALVQLAGAPVALLADAVSFVVSAVLLARIRVEEQVAAATGASLRADVAAGLRFALRNPFHRSMAVTGTISNFLLAGQGALLVIFLVREVGLSGGLVGVLFALGAVGALAGSLVAGRLAKRFGDALVIRVGPVVVAAAGLLIPLTTPGLGLAWFVAGQMIMFAGVAVFNVCVRAAVQIGTPPELLGRAGTSIRLFSRGALPLGDRRRVNGFGALGPRDDRDPDGFYVFGTGSAAPFARGTRPARRRDGRLGPGGHGSESSTIAPMSRPSWTALWVPERSFIITATTIWSSG
jgi:MFS family permease